METYSLSLTDQPVVEPNIAIQSVNVPSGGKEGSTGVLFTVLKGELFVLPRGKCCCPPSPGSSVSLLPHLTPQEEEEVPGADGYAGG